MNTRFYNAKILTIKPDKSFEVIEGELWVHGNKICYVGDGTGKEEVYKDLNTNVLIWDREIDTKGNLLMPGFKNAHTHSAMTAFRSLADDLPLQEWLFQKIFPLEAKLLPEDVYWLTSLANMEYLTSGITAQFDMYLFQDEVARASIDCGFRTVQTSGLNNFGGTIEELEEKYLRLRDIHELCSYTIGFHAEYTTSLPLMEDIAKLVHKYKSPMFVHNSETKLETDECRERHGLSPTQLFDKLGMYEFGGGGYHCVWFDEKDIDIFAQKGLTAVTNPGSNSKLASGIAPIHQMLQKGVNLAIGTDGASSNNCLDMFREMFLVSSMAKLREMDAAVLDGDDVLYMAMAGGAKAMGLDDCDNLAPGKKADIIMIDLKQPNMQPINNLTKNIVYSGSKQNVKMTMINGKVLYEDQKFHIGLDPEDIYQNANKIIERIKQD